MEPLIYVSTASVRSPRDLPAVLERMAAAGIERIEVSAPHPHLEAAELRALLQQRLHAGTRFLFHNYFPAPQQEVVINLASLREGGVEASLAIAEQALSLGAELGVPVYACHAGYQADARPLGKRFDFEPVDESSTSRRHARMLASIERLLALPPVAEGRIAFAIENLFPPSGTRPNHSFCCRPEDLDAVLERFPRLGLLLDLGHLNVSAHWLGFDRDEALDEILDRHGERIVEIHLSANDGHADSHLPLKPQDWQTLALPRLRGLRGTGGGVFYCLESRGLSEPQCLEQMDLIREALG